MKNSTYIYIQIGNDISELCEKKYRISFDEMHNRFPCLAKEIEEARDYANAENLNEEELYDGSSREDLINSDEKFQ